MLKTFVSAIIAAGGRGLRLGGAQPKQLLAIGGRPMLERSVSSFLTHPKIDEVIVALPRDLAAEPPGYLRQASKPLRVVAGGERRQDSVANAFGQVAAHADIVVVHDAARPFASAALIARTIDAAGESGAAVAAMRSRDTVKLAEFDDTADERSRRGPHVRETLARESIFLAQTPQAFRREVLRAALSLTIDASDEAMLVERSGQRVRLVEGEASNVKITTAEDLPIAEAIARRGDPSMTPLVGTGYDLHRLVTGRPLVVGGVAIPSDRGAFGHSDADVVCHAITDAVLGAACLGDIGQHFPDADARWKNASSLDLLARALTLVRERGLDVGNVDVTVVLEAPKIRPHVEAMRAAIGRTMGLAVDRISIKGKTNEGVDAIGRGEALAAHAIVLLNVKM